MKKPSIDQMNDQELIETFRRYARNYGKAIIDGEVGVANNAFKNVWAIRSLLMTRGSQARLILLPLMEDPDAAVRYFAAVTLLIVLPERARAVLDEIAADWSGAADITIYAREIVEGLDNGSYKPR